MPSKLLKTDFGEEFKERVATAQRVQIASAWMTESKALNALLERKCDVQAIIGISGDATTPTSLRSLVRRFGPKSLRITNQKPLFHPKLFLFHRDPGPTIAWIGSANFTAHGMGVNTELMLQTDEDCVVREMNLWFETQWKCLCQDVERVLSDYEAKPKDPSPYVGDRGGRSDLLPLLPGTTIQVRPKPRVNNHLHGQIVFGKSDSATYETGIEGLSKLLERLSRGREDDFLTRCRKEPAFQRAGRRFIARGRSEEEALQAELYPHQPRRLSPQTSTESRWWISGTSNSKDKWRMIKAAVKVANDLGDELRLENEDLPSWPE